VPFLVPVPGLVIRYSYLWSAEHARGQEEGVKDRPCAIIFTTANDAGDQVVTVLPISHTPPSNPLLAVEPKTGGSRASSPCSRRIRHDPGMEIFVGLQPLNRRGDDEEGEVWPSPLVVGLVSVSSRSRVSDAASLVGR
jgi:hypothetical protein